MSKALLIQELRATVSQINTQIKAMEEMVADRPMQDLYRMKFQDGKFVMVEMLAAKAQALNGIAVLLSAKTK